MVFKKLIKSIFLRFPWLALESQWLKYDPSGQVFLEPFYPTLFTMIYIKLLLKINIRPLKLYFDGYLGMTLSGNAY